MPDFIGNIAVPEIVASGVFPIMPDYPYGRASHPDVIIHQFGSGNAKIEQRFLLGAGAKRFTVRRAWLNDAQRIALRNFWESKYGPYGAFTYKAPNDDGNGTTAYTCRFANEPLSWEMVADWACTVGVTLIEIPAGTPEYALNSTATRFPAAGLQTALLSQVQQLIPLVKVQPLQAGYPAIYLSDRRCIVGGQLYQARLLNFDGIQQGMAGEADDASFTFGNADRVMRDLANDADLYRAALEFSLFHVGQGVKLDLWKGDVTDWTVDAGPEFKLSASDGLYELNLPYPCRKASRTCWKPFNSQACPYASVGALDLVHFPNADASCCDKNYDTPNGCLAHGMKRYYGGILAKPDSVQIKDNSTGVWGFRRSTITSTSLVAESIYDQVLPEIYTDSNMPVNCRIAMGREESDFYEALGIVGEGPLGAFTYPGMQDKDCDGVPEKMVAHTLDGQPHHGFPNNLYGLRTYMGKDPADPGDWFSLDEAGDQTGGDWRKVYAGGSTLEDNFAAGTAFIVIRRTDAKGIQLSKPADHAMVAQVCQGLKGWTWSAPGVRTFGDGPFGSGPLSNPIWIAINMLLRARGLRLGADATQQQLDLAETMFDVPAAVAAAAICNQDVTPLVYGTVKVWVPDENPEDPSAGHWEDQQIVSDKQFKFRGVIQEEKPLRDWLQEVLMNCLGYYTFFFGKLKLGVRENASVVEAFTDGNILFRSLQLAPIRPAFNYLSANFADEEFDFVANSVAVYDIDHAALIGGSAGPLFLKSTANLCGTYSKSQAGRIISARLREELGGITPEEWKAARQVSFKTTVLALNTEPGMVCSMTHPDMPCGSGKFRIVSWRLNPDYSIDVQGRTVTDSMYDLVDGPKPADVGASPVPGELILDLIPGDVQPIDGQPFAVSQTASAGTDTFEIAYNPPATIGVFQGGTVHIEMPDGSGKIAQATDFDYNGDPEGVGAARYGTCKIVVSKGAAELDIRLYVCSRSRAYKKPLTFHGVTGESPNVQQHIAAATGATPPAQPSAVALSELGPRVKSDYGRTVTTLRATLTGGGASADRAEVRLFKDGAELHGQTLNGPVYPLNSGHIDFPAYCPTGNEPWVVKVALAAPDAANSWSAAVASAPVVIAGIGDAAANNVATATVCAPEYVKNVDGVWFFGFQVSGSNVASDPNWWTTKITAQWGTLPGGVWTSAEAPADASQLLGLEYDKPGAFTDFWGGWPCRTGYTLRIQAWARSRGTGWVLQTSCWNGADHVDITPGTPSASLQATRLDAATFGPGVSQVAGSNLLTLNLGNGMTLSGNQLVPNLGNGVQLSGATIAIRVGSLGGLVVDAAGLGIQSGPGVGVNIYDQAYVRTSGGLGVDGSNNVQVNRGNGLTTSGVNLTLNLGNGLTTSGGQAVVNTGNGLTISGAAVVANLGNGLQFSGAVMQINASGGLNFNGTALQANLTTGLVLNNGAIKVDITVGLAASGNAIGVNAGAGLGTSGMQLVIPNNGVSSDMVAGLAASKLSAGQITVGSGGMEFSGSGGITIANGGSILVVSPGTVSAGVLIGGGFVGGDVLRHSDSTVIVNGSKQGFFSDITASGSIRSNSGFNAWGNAGVTGNFSLKKDDGTSITLSFSGGILTGSW